METVPAEKGKTLDMIPKDWLKRTLEIAAQGTGACLRITALDGTPVMTVKPTAAEETGTCPEEEWPAGEETAAAEAVEKNGWSFTTLPLRRREESIGYLTACRKAGTGEDDRFRTILALAAAQIEGLVDAGYEVESLAGEVVRVYEELTLIYRLSSELGTRFEIEEICRIVIEEAEKILHPKNIVFQLADEVAGVFRTIFATGMHREDALRFAPKLDQGIIGWVFANLRPAIVSDVEKKPDGIEWPFPVRHLLVLPLMAENKGLGVVFVTDKRDGSDFDTQEEKLLSAIASVAAISIKNSQLYSEIKNLFEGFIDASVSAIEARDPTTSGHSARVATLTEELGKLVDASDLPHFRKITFTKEQLLEIRYAGLLHDFGKIGVKETVLLKGAKLFGKDLERIRDRFGYIKEKKLREALEKKLDIILSKGNEAFTAETGEIDSRVALEIARLDADLDFLEIANDPRILLTDLPEPERLSALAERLYIDMKGESKPYLTQFEFQNLKILKGSLNPDERKEIESHVTHSYRFLCKIPWTRSFPQIADIVHSHHEKIDGSGYPQGLKGENIPFQAKMMTVADIFDALTAWDRPYKKAVSVDKALFILETEAREGKLDPHLVRLFREARVYDTVENMRTRR
ncbi:MAG: GAF domain-containing protein [Geobacter sp.]|nr:GAF domain-containing protein [Geobacter sp.]